MEHEENQGTEAEGVAGVPAAAFPAVVDAPVPAVDPAAWQAAQSQISVLESRLARAEEENRAFMLSLRHAAAAAEELLDEARIEAAAIRDTATREAAHVHADLDARRGALVSDARRDATRILEEARVAAYELVVVARADAREAVHEERRRAADDLEMLAAIRERISEERCALTQFHTQLSGRLRHLVQAMLEFAEQGPELETGDAGFAATVLTGPQAARAIEPAAATEASPDAAPMPVAGDRAASHSEEEHLERAFDEFFSSDVEHEPSRRWILED